MHQMRWKVMEQIHQPPKNILKPNQNRFLVWSSFRYRLNISIQARDPEWVTQMQMYLSQMLPQLVDAVHQRILDMSGNQSVSGAVRVAIVVNPTP